MATLWITPQDYDTIRWSCSLGAEWNQSNYIQVVLCTSGTLDANGNPVGYKASMSAPSTGTSTGTQSVEYSSSSLIGTSPKTWHAFAQAANGTYYYVGSNTFTMPEQAPSSVTGLNGYAIDSDSIYVYWDSSSRASGYDIYKDGSYFTSTYGTNATINSLNPSTAYSITVYAYNSGGSSSGISVNIATTGATPDPFYFAPFVTGNDTTGLSSTEWNNFTARINQWRTYKGLGSYSFTQAIQDSQFTAVMFNQAIYAINDMKATGATLKNQFTSKIIASEIKSLAITLNSIT